MQFTKLEIIYLTENENFEQRLSLHHPFKQW